MKTKIRYFILGSILMLTVNVKGQTWTYSAPYLGTTVPIFVNGKNIVGDLSSGDSVAISSLNYNVAFVGVTHGSARHALFGTTQITSDILFVNNVSSTFDYYERMRINRFGRVGIGTSAPDTSALLDVSSTNKGLLIPRVALTATNDGTTIPLPATSLLVYNTNGGLAPAGYWYNAGSSGLPNWVQLATTQNWQLTGNAGTTASTAAIGTTVNNNFIGTTDAKDWVMATNNLERARITSGGNVGIGTSSPLHLLSVVTHQNAATRIFVNNNNTGSGAYAIFQATGANGTVYLGNTRSNALGNSVGTEIGYLQGSGMPLFVGTSNSYELRLVTNNTERVRVDASGNVGIGLTNPAYKLEVTGNFNVNGVATCTAGAWGSDQMFKTNIDSIQNALAVIKQLKPKTYYFDTTNVWGLNFPSAKQHGFVAQDLEQVLPELVTTVKKNEVVDSSGNVINPATTYKSVYYLELIPYLTKGIQEQSNVIDSLKAKTIQQDSINEAVQTKASNQDSIITSLQNQLITNNTLFQNQLDQLMTTINNCCTLSMQSPTNNNQQNKSMIIPEGETTQMDVELNNAQIIILLQNSPNPFAERTSINYYLPDNTGKAQILFYNAQGKLIQSAEIIQKGKGTLNVYGRDLSSGIYTYSLVVDGKIIETKKMIKQ